MEKEKGGVAWSQLVRAGIKITQGTLRSASRGGTGQREKKNNQQRTTSSSMKGKQRKKKPKNSNYSEEEVTLGEQKGRVFLGENPLLRGPKPSRASSSEKREAPSADISESQQRRAAKWNLKETRGNTITSDWDIFMNVKEVRISKKKQEK